jgi:hypothetical protein
MAWQQIGSVSQGSLNGWPCTIITSSHLNKRVLYLMVLGTAKQRMIESIKEYAGADNVLVDYYERNP